MIGLARFIATIFYFIGILGSIILFGKLSGFTDAMNSFFGFSSFSTVTNAFIIMFLLSNIAVGLVIHLLAEILHYIMHIYYETKHSNVRMKSAERTSDKHSTVEDTTTKSVTENNAAAQTKVRVETHEKEELSFFYQTLLKIQNLFQKK